MARPDELTPDTQKRICRELKAGNTREDSAVLADICPATFFNWMKRGRNNEPKFLEFLKAVKRAEAHARKERIARIRKAGKKGNWTADAWYLERRDPEHFGLNNREIRELQKELKEIKKAVGLADDSADAPPSQENPTEDNGGQAQNNTE